MRSIALDRFGLSAEATEILAAYLSALDGRLPGGRHTRAVILAELADGLGCAVEAEVAQGVPPTEAARRAVAEFGDPAVLAVQFAGQMLARTTHRTGMALVLSGPMVGLLWVSWLGAGLSTWSAKVVAALTDVRVLPVILLLTVPCAVIAASASGRWGRLVTVPAGWTYRAGLLATAGCVVADATLIGGAFADREAATVSAGLLLAVMASVLRAGLAGLAMHRLMRQHAAAN